MTRQELFEELAKAHDAYTQAEKEESVARGVRTEALNRLNRAQKAVDESMEQLRKDAPRETDWKQHERRGIRVEG